MNEGQTVKYVRSQQKKDCEQDIQEACLDLDSPLFMGGRLLVKIKDFFLPKFSRPL